jgi:hypothetical protein
MSRRTVRFATRFLGLAVFALAASSPALAAQPHSTSATAKPSAGVVRTGTTSVSVTTDPALFPSFDETVTNYVIRCIPGTLVHVSADSPSGTSISVDGQPAQQGAFSTDVNVSSGQSFTINVSPPGGGTATYYLRCLPPDFPTYTVSRPGTPQAQYYIAAPAFSSSSSASGSHYVIVFNNRGVPIWWYKSGPSPAYARLLPDGNMLWTDLNGGTGAEEHSLDGSLVRTVAGVGAPMDFHEFVVLPNGDYVFPVGKLRRATWCIQNGTFNGVCMNGDVWDALIQEVTPAGSLVWQWDAMDHIPVSETDPQWWSLIFGPSPLGVPGYDTYHLNSIEPDGAGGFVVSFRHLDAVYDIDQATGNIKWKLGGSQRPESLTILNDSGIGPGFGGQHDARILSDGTLTLHDNGTGRGRAPRAVRYLIDPVAQTATLIEQVTDSTAPGSFCCGSARRLPGGDWMMSWGGDSVVTELSATNTPVFRLVFDSGLFSYRAEPILPGQLNAPTLRAGMDAQFPRTTSASVKR